MDKPYYQWDLTKWLSDLEARNTEEIQLGLARIQAVAQGLQLQKPKCPVITVAGTNGKGSTVTALECLYATAGYRVGSYTSPHLFQFNERIRVDLIPISDLDLCQAFCIIEEARGATNLTYFEMTTLAALIYFKKKCLDVIILEVGLGGRLDATNIIDADLSIITTIDFDHQDFLGDTLEAIASEKAGILREGKPFVYADLNPPSTLIDASIVQSTPRYFLDKEFSIKEYAMHWSFYFGEKQINNLPKPRIQLKSAAAAITATILLQNHLPLTEEHIQSALRTVFIPGRLQLQEGRVNVLYDVSHNPQSVRLLANTLKKISKEIRIHAVFSALKDKDIMHMIEPLIAYVTHWYPAKLDGKRSISADLLLFYFKNAEISVEICYNNPLIAFEAALSQANAGDLIVVYGSFFTVSQVMASVLKLEIL